MISFKKITDLNPENLPAWVKEDDLIELRSRAEVCFGKMVEDKEKRPRFTIQMDKVTEDFLLQLAGLYHRNGIARGCSFQELATMLGPGHHAAEIKRFLTHAEDTGLFKLEYHPKGESLNAKLQREFELKRPPELVISTQRRDELLQNLGIEAAKLFDHIWKERGSMHAAIGGGEAVHAFVESLRPIDRTLLVSPLAFFSRAEVGTMNEGKMMDAPFLAMALMWKSRCDASICATPPLPQGKPDKALEYTAKLFEMSDALQSVFDTACDADVIFTGAGKVDSSSPILATYKRAGIDLKALTENGCIGHLNFSAFDENGNDLSRILSGVPKKKPHPNCHPFVPAISLDHFHKLAEKGSSKDVVLIAGGPGKFKVIQTALRERFVNCLVTDTDTARRLLQEGRGEPKKRTK